MRMYNNYEYSEEKLSCSACCFCFLRLKFSATGLYGITVNILLLVFMASQ